MTQCMMCYWLSELEASTVSGWRSARQGCTGPVLAFGLADISRLDTVYGPWHSSVKEQRDVDGPSLSDREREGGRGRASGQRRPQLAPPLCLLPNGSVDQVSPTSCHTHIYPLPDTHLVGSSYRKGGLTRVCRAHHPGAQPPPPTSASVDTHPHSSTITRDPPSGYQDPHVVSLR